MPGPPGRMTEVPQRRAMCVKTVRQKFVNIGSQKEHWFQVKSKKGCQSDEDVARLLIKSFYQWENKKVPFHPVSSARRRRKQRVFKQDSYRVLTLQKDVWSRWIDLKKHLRIDCNSKLATVLIDAWYERTNHVKKMYATQQCVSEFALQSHSENSATNTDFDKEVDNMVKAESVSSQTTRNPEANKEITEIISHAKVDKRLIKLAQEETETSQDLTKRRISSRVRSRGFRPNYASMDWKDDIESDSENIAEKSDNQFDSKEEISEGITEQMAHITRVKTSKHFCDKTKKGVEKDPDFVVSDDEAKYLNLSDEDTRDLDFSDICDETTEIVQDENIRKMDNETSKPKPGRKRKQNKSDYSQGVKCKRKRVKKKLDEFSVTLEKKSKPERRAKKESVSERENMKKPWVHIKLEDHREKYRMEIVGSFERKNRNSNLTEELYTCMLCGRFKSTAKDIFEEHIEKHVNMVLECDLCTYVGRSEVELMRHKVSAGHMRKGQEYMCDICGMVLYTWDSRLSHMGKEHDDPQFKCKFCDYKFVTRLKRQQHTRTVHADVAQYCNSCKTDCQTLTFEEFRQHQENCKPGHQCQVCGVVLASKNGLSSHLKATHMGVRKYQCQVCPYAGKSAQRLREHVMTHTSVHPYSCDKCTFTCVQACQLKSHMRTHSGEKPFKCTRCNFAAAWNVQLKYHLSIHELETSVICRQCDVVFKNEKALKMHEKKDHCVFRVLESEKSSN